jgi:pyruvate dehydrogenase E1 component beta subunit
VPLDDIDTLVASVKKTGRFIVVHEAPKTCGYGAELISLVCREGVLSPRRRSRSASTGYDTPFPYTLEPLYMPDVKRVVAGIEKTFVW